MCRICRMGGRLRMRRKGLEDLNVYSILLCNGGWGACEGQALALQAPMRFFSSCGGRHAYTNAMQVFLHRLPCPRNRFLILAILIILAILLQTRETLRSSRTFSRGAIDIKVFQTFAPFAAASSCSSCSSCKSCRSCFRQTKKILDKIPHFL